MTSKLITVTEGNDRFVFEALENCSISQMLAQTHKFYEADFLRAISKLVKPGAWAVDIGAHLGNHSIYFAKVLGMRVMAFEANPAAFTALKANITRNEADKLVSAQNLAIADSAGTVQLTPVEPFDAGTFSIVRKEGAGQIRCRSVTLDSFFDYFQSRKPALIKLDIEGAESLALAGAKKTIEAFKPIIATEVMDGNSLDDVAGYLLPLGYIPVGVYNATPTVIWTTERLVGQEDDSAVQQSMDFVRYAVESAAEAKGFRAEVIRLKSELEALKSPVVVSINQVNEKAEVSSSRDPKLDTSNDLVDPEDKVSSSRVF